MSKKLPLEFQSLLAEARRNEITLRKFQSLELQLLGCRSLAELIKMLLYENRAAFEWDRVTLTLFDPAYEIRRLLTHAGVPDDLCRDLIFITEPDQLPEAYRAQRLPRLGAFDERFHGALFPQLRKALASAAVLPLVRSEQPIGSLNIGSHKVQRFREDSGTDFLQHLAAVISVCLETAVNQERLKDAGLTDALTGVNNRRFFDQRLPEEVARSRRFGQPLSSLFIDIDHFKAINDQHGHVVGDKALQAVAALIRDQLRSIDVVARYGGEEFAVLLAGANAHEAVDVAERIRRSLIAHAVAISDDIQLNLSASIGVATLHSATDAQQADNKLLGAQLIEAADRRSTKPSVPAATGSSARDRKPDRMVGDDIARHVAALVTIHFLILHRTHVRPLA